MIRRSHTLTGLTLLLIGLALSFAGISPVVSAESAHESPATKSALVVSPAIIEEVLTPGAPTDFTLQIQNATNFPLPIKTFVRNLIPKANSSEQVNSDRLDASQWFVVEEPDFILQPKQVRTVKGRIQPPPDAIPGGHYATLYFQPLVPEEALSPSTAYISARVGVLAFLIVKGDIEQKAELKNGLHTSSFTQSGPVTFTFAIRNSGNVHLMPSGRLNIYDWHNRRVASKEIPAGIILPGETKNYTMLWEDVPRFGKFRAELLANYGADNVQLTKTTASFWVMSWIKMLLGTVVLAAIAAFVIKTRHRWKKAWRALRSG